MKLPRLFARRRSEAQEESQAPQVSPGEVPPDLVLAIAAASAMDRGKDEEGKSRIIVMFNGGGGGVLYEADEVKKWMLKRWPGLTDKQFQRAAGMLRDRVAAFLERAQIDEANRLGLSSPSHKWAAWRPLRHLG